MRKIVLPLSLGIIIILAVVGYSAFTDTLTLQALSDRLFLFSLPLMIVSGFLWVRSSGFFHLFQQSFQLKKQKKTAVPSSSIPAGPLMFSLVLTGLLLGASLLFLFIASV
ncbi:hypothetical protein [Enterococcus pallens]|uniref:DUF3899 domain-containing protein n=1 Tax=Enterococcus pallens ATCC BAA-351 TaxID=1158607 RepID=R2QEF0_9ENTE|nr:hypothetical protein [Enterococcus pallens]EOH93618.1 hypothetical protein UAU_02314 [Enterococcus pallens ATCC BAA-351]EOU24458.1 hypothetical protein I588_00445 [Enterococcus pallens ATCC BAA-351]OJG77112.1 hypothetical protein RV10_GL002951 [Enterococcus pallens]